MAGWRPKIYRVLERCVQTHLVRMRGGWGGWRLLLAGAWLVSLLA